MMVLDSESDFRFDMYHRMDITDEEVILSEVLEDEQYTEIGDNEDGRNYINEVLISAAAESSNSLYDASRAVAYAVAHAKDIPEYSAANNNGSDCANFVSKCINAGGFHRIELGIGIRVPQIGFVQDITTMAVLFHILREKDILDRFPLVVQQQRGVLCIITRRAMLPL